MCPARGLVCCTACLAALAAHAAPALAAAPDVPAYPAQRQSLANDGERWTFLSLYSYSGLSGGREGWNEAEFELSYRASPKLTYGGRVDIRDRSQATDTLYTAMFSYRASPALEWHGALRLAPNADFSARQTYAAGLEWHLPEPVTLLFDVERLNFSEGPVDQYRPGITYWFTEQTFLTARYTYGRAFHEERFDAVSLRLNLGLAGGQRLSLGIAHGADPEKDPAVPGVILSTADTYSVYYHRPLRPQLELVVGVAYEDRRDIYRRKTATVGFVKRF
jgi:YaiO family outer membrane protein